MATTKDSLLRYFATLDVNTLERLKRYSSFIIIPDEDLLVNATMSQMIEKAHDLADSLFPEWTDRSKSDFGEFLVELFALYSEKDFWYINAFANEGTFRKIRSYSNAFSKASTLGYAAKTCKGASAQFSVKFAAGAAITYERGELVLVANGKEFSNDEPFTVAASNTVTTKTLTLHEGTQIAEDATFSGYCVFIRKQNVDIDSLKVKIDNVTYTRVRNFGESGQASAHYLVLPEEDGSCSIFFGTNGFGATPALGKVIQLEYRTCNGSDGNIANGEFAEVKVNDSLSEREATSASLLEDATGGTYAETLTSIKEKAPMYFANKRAAINEATAEEILNSYDFVAKSVVYTLGSNVYYSVIPTSGDLEPTATEKTFMVNNFEPNVVLGFTAEYAQNEYVNFLFKANPSATGILLDVIVLSGYSASIVEQSVRQVMEDITNPLVYAEYGKGFSKADAAVLMQSRVAGLQSISFKMLLGSVEDVIPDFEMQPTEILRKISQELITVRINAV